MNSQRDSLRIEQWKMEGETLKHLASLSGVAVILLVGFIDKVEGNSLIIALALAGFGVCVLVAAIAQIPLIGLFSLVVRNEENRIKQNENQVVTLLAISWAGFLMGIMGLMSIGLRFVF